MNSKHPLGILLEFCDIGARCTRSSLPVQQPAGLEALAQTQDTLNSPVLTTMQPALGLLSWFLADLRLFVRVSRRRIPGLAGGGYAEELP